VCDLTLNRWRHCYTCPSGASRVRAILTYHSVDNSGSVISVSPSRFADDMRGLAASGVAVVSVDALVNGDGPTSAVAITFDDAFTNFATDAWPILRDLGWPVTLFVPSGHVGKTNAWEVLRRTSSPALPILSWDNLAQLAADGVTIGAHSRSHPDLRTLAPTALAEEIDGVAHDVQQALGVQPTGFAYPYGQYNAAVMHAVQRRYAWAVTTVLGPLSQPVNPFQLPRLDAYFLRGPAATTRYGSLLFQGYLAMRAALRALKSP